jgi:hypothetical protein
MRANARIAAVLGQPIRTRSNVIFVLSRIWFFVAEM